MFWIFQLLSYVNIDIVSFVDSFFLMYILGHLYSRRKLGYACCFWFYVSSNLELLFYQNLRLLKEHCLHADRFYLFNWASLIFYFLWIEITLIQTNSQLLAACYLQGNQAHSAYHILKGTYHLIRVFSWMMLPPDLIFQVIVFVKSYVSPSKMWVKLNMTCFI